MLETNRTFLVWWTCSDVVGCVWTWLEVFTLFWANAQGTDFMKFEEYREAPSHEKLRTYSVSYMDAGASMHVWYVWMCVGT